MLSAGPATEPVAVVAANQPAVNLAASTGPRVTRTTPARNATGVDVSAAVMANVAVPLGGVDGATLAQKKAVFLFRTKDNKTIPAAVNTSGGGDIIILKPRSPLEPRTNYTFVVTSTVKDVKGNAFPEYRASFTTGSAPAGSGLPGVAFSKSPQAASNGRQYFSLAMGPDRRLYAGTSDGLILRFPVNADGSLGTPKTIDTIRRVEAGKARFVTGLAFDPRSTAAAPVLWVSHSAYASVTGGGTPGADWSGKLTVLSGADLSASRHAVVNLPRSVRDHVTNQPVFGPDGALYVSQPSNTGMGAPDAAWGNRPERLLSATILRLDVARLGNATLDARTRDGGGSYDPAAPGAPLTIYATGVRNAFDLVWHSSGSLYAPGNGSASGGNAPAGGGAPALRNIPEDETDYLFRVQPGAYYGHPNPLQGEFVLNGGNPNAGEDQYEVSAYPVGTRPDPAWHPAAFDLGPHQAPTGVLEYRGTAFGGTLDGKLLLARYSGGDDVVALDVRGGQVRQYAGIPGLTGLVNPIDLVQDRANGNLYVSEDGPNRITLLRPTGAGSPARSLEAETPTGDSPEASPEVLAEPLAEPPMEPLPEPPPVPAPDMTPAPPPVSPTRSAGEQKLVGRIDSFAKSHDLSAGDLTHVSGSALKALYRDLRARAGLVAKVVKVAKKVRHPLPDLSAKPVGELRDLLATLRRG